MTFDLTDDDLHLATRPTRPELPLGAR